MITVTEKQNVQRTNVEEESTFKIKATPKAFKILSSQLYSDKISAIIREISCNAYDAMVDAGTEDTPFVVHLPNTLEPWFSVRDNGTGLSDDHMRHLYTTYFESTKETSNDFTGCLGLGSKSPLCYVDNFMVASYFNGVKRIYNIFENEVKEPSISMLSETDTDEHNGLEVSVAVPEKDFDEFRRKTEDIMRYFKSQPEVIGNPRYVVDPVAYIMKETGWGIRASSHYAEYGANAVMGNVRYPLSDIDTDALTYDERGLLHCNVDLFFNIGELEIAASRESLSYDKRTIDSIVKRVKEVLADVEGCLVKAIEDADNLWDARCKYRELRNDTLSTLSGIIDKIDVSYDGVTINDRFVSHKIDNLSLTMLELKDGYSRDKGHFDKMSKEQWVTGLRPSYRTIIIENDLTVGAYVRSKGMMVDSKYDETKDAVTKMYLVKFRDADERKDFLKAMGLPADHVFTLTSSLPKPVQGRTDTYNPKNAVKILEYAPDGYDGCTNSTAWEKVAVDKNAGGFYVPIDRYKVRGMKPNCIKWMLKLLDKIDAWDDGDTVYGVKFAMLETVKANSNWVNLFDYTKEKLQEYAKSDDIKIILSAKRHTDHVDKGWIKRMETILEDWYDAPKSLHTLIEEYKEVQSYRGKQSDVIEAMEHYQVEFSEDDVFELRSLYDTACDQYPMLGYMFYRVWNLSNTDIKNARDYITAMDALREGREDNCIEGEKTACKAA